MFTDVRLGGDNSTFILGGAGEAVKPMEVAACEIEVTPSAFQYGKDIFSLEGVYPHPFFVRVANAGLRSLRVKRVREE